MKRVISKVWSVVTINNILSVVLMAYIGKAVSSLYGMSQVPLAEEGPGKGPSVVSHMKLNDSFDIHMYLSLDPYTEIKDSFYLGNFTNAVYSNGMPFSHAITRLARRFPRRVCSKFVRRQWQAPFVQPCTPCIILHESDHLLANGCQIENLCFKSQILSPFSPFGPVG